MDKKTIIIVSIFLLFGIYTIIENKYYDKQIDKDTKTTVGKLISYRIAKGGTFYSDYFFYLNNNKISNTTYFGYGSRYYKGIFLQDSCYIVEYSSKNPKKYSRITAKQVACPCELK